MQYKIKGLQPEALFRFLRTSAPSPGVRQRGGRQRPSGGVRPGAGTVGPPGRGPQRHHQKSPPLRRGGQGPGHDAGGIWTWSAKSEPAWTTIFETEGGPDLVVEDGVLRANGTTRAATTARRWR